MTREQLQELLRDNIDMYEVGEIYVDPDYLVIKLYEPGKIIAIPIDLTGVAVSDLSAPIECDGPSSEGDWSR